MQDITEDRLKQLLEEAAQRGADRALARVGLGDEQAVADIKDVRDWLRALRIVKSEALKTTASVVTKVFLLGIVAGLLYLAGFHVKIGGP